MAFEGIWWTEILWNSYVKLPSVRTTRVVVEPLIRTVS